MGYDFNEYQKHIVRCAMLSELPDKRKSDSQQNDLNESYEYLQDQLENHIKAISNQYLKFVDDFDTEALAAEVQNLLHDHRLAPIPQTISLQSIQTTMQQNQYSWIAVSAWAERYSPMLAKWDNSISKFKSVCRTMTMLKTDWKASGLFDILFPDELNAKHESLKLLVGMVRRRRDRLEKHQQVLSRLMSGTITDYTAGGTREVYTRSD